MGQSNTQKVLSGTFISDLQSSFLIDLCTMKSVFFVSDGGGGSSIRKGPEKLFFSIPPLSHKKLPGAEFATFMERK